MKDKVENKVAQVGCSMRRIRILHAILCIFLAGIVCLCCALLGFILLRAQTKASLRDSDANVGKIRIYIDQGHNPAPHHNTGAEGNGFGLKRGLKERRRNTLK